MEPLWGIPATVGGACFMNAGAYDGTTGEVLESVRAYVPSKQGNRGSVVTPEARDPAHGVPQEPRPRRWADRHLRTFKLFPSTLAMVRAAMDDYRARREESSRSRWRAPAYVQ